MNVDKKALNFLGALDINSIKSVDLNPNKSNGIPCKSSLCNILFTGFNSLVSLEDISSSYSMPRAFDNRTILSALGNFFPFSISLI